MICMIGRWMKGVVWLLLHFSSCSLLHTYLLFPFLVDTTFSFPLASAFAYFSCFFDTQLDQPRGIRCGWSTVFTWTLLHTAALVCCCLSGFELSLGQTGRVGVRLCTCIWEGKRKDFSSRLLRDLE